MSRPPMKAIASIKNYCEKTQCRRCVFGKVEKISFDDYVMCRLQEDNPCDWEVDEQRGEE